jgi:hypothetical protein
MVVSIPTEKSIKCIFSIEKEMTDLSVSIETDGIVWGLFPTDGSEGVTELADVIGSVASVEISGSQFVVTDYSVPGGHGRGPSDDWGLKLTLYLWAPASASNVDIKNGSWQSISVRFEDQLPVKLSANSVTNCPFPK